MAILIGPDGAIESLCRGGQELIDSVAPVIVSDDKWQNFEDRRLAARSRLRQLPDTDR